LLFTFFQDWDKPEHIPDPDAKQPEDWDEEMDGEWEPPMIDNPEYKGEWLPKQIDNPNYSGVWVHPMIDNPEYEADDQLYSYEDFGVIGLDLWQVRNPLLALDLSITHKIANNLSSLPPVRADSEHTINFEKFVNGWTFTSDEPLVRTGQAPSSDCGRLTLVRAYSEYNINFEKSMNGLLHLKNPFPLVRTGQAPSSDCGRLCIIKIL